MSVHQYTELSPNSGASHQAEIIPLRPQNEGVINNREIGALPVYSSVMDSSNNRLLSQGRSDGFHWHIERQQTDDGIAFDVGYFEPEVRRSDVALYIDTSWTTQVKGLNSHTASIAARLGMPSIVKGPEIGSSIPLSHSAHNTHALMDAVENEGFAEKGIAVHKGFSRGAMIGLGVNAYAEQFNRTMLYAEEDDPCLAHSIFDVSPEEIVDYAQYVPKEIATTLLKIGRIVMDPRRVRYYHRTIDVSGRGFKQIVQTGMPLFSGEAGLLADHVSQDAFMNIAFQKGMPANHRNDFTDRLSGRPGVMVSELEGTHTGAIGRKGSGEFILRIVGLIDQIDEGVPTDQIDFTKVHLPSAA